MASDYRKRDVIVAGMLQFDVIGHHKAGINRIGINSDKNHHSPAAANFLRILTDEYLTYGRQDRTCGFVRKMLLFTSLVLVILYF